MSLLDKIYITPLSQIFSPGGEVWHALKKTEESYNGFGEAYFSWVDPGAIKAWKLHSKMTMNLVVPFGSVRFVFYDQESDSFKEEEIGKALYARLTVPPKIWFGFQGISEVTSLMLNVANMPHDPEETERKSLEEIRFNWQEVS